MNLIKNKKAGEGTEYPLAKIIGWIILFALLLFAFFWFSGLGSKIITIIKTFLK